MKASMTEECEGFKPIKLEIVFESAEELDSFYDLSLCCTGVPDLIYARQGPTKYRKERLLGELLDQMGKTIKEFLREFKEGKLCV